MKPDEYLLKMFKEFSRAYGINDTIENFEKYQELFSRWVQDKRKASISYVQLFDYMKKSAEVEPTIIAEFGKGIYDTAAISMNNHTQYRTIIISPYAKTIALPGIEIYEGELEAFAYGQSRIKYNNAIDYSIKPNCHHLFNDDINVLMTQLPYTDKELRPFLNLVDSEKTLFIGTYGSLKDKDREENIRKIRDLYDSLHPINYRDIDICYETENDSYVSAVKINSKQKVLHKSLTRY